MLSVIHFLSSILSVVVSLMTQMYLYRSFLVPLGAPALDYPTLIGIRIFIGQFQPNTFITDEMLKKVRDTSRTAILQSIGANVGRILVCALAAGIGWICLHIH